MSGVGSTCATGEVANITTAKTIIRLAAANYRVRIKNRQQFCLIPDEWPGILGSMQWVLVPRNNL